MGDYDYHLPLPGEVCLREMGTVVRARVSQPEESGSLARNPRDRMDLDCLALVVSPGSPLTLRVRNWRAGDRFWPLHAKAPKKVKELLQERRVCGAERTGWPVAVDAAGELVWLRGFGVAAKFAATPSTQRAIAIEEEKGVR